MQANVCAINWNIPAHSSCILLFCTALYIAQAADINNSSSSGVCHETAVVNLSQAGETLPILPRTILSDTCDVYD